MERVITTDRFKECSLPNRLSLRSLFTFFLQRFEKDHDFKGETHDFMEAVFVLSGTVGITAEKQVFELHPCQMVLHPAGEFHAIRSAKGSQPEVVVVSFNATAFPALPNERVFHLSPNAVAELKDLFLSAQSAFEFDGICLSGVKDGKEFEACAVIKRLELIFLQAFQNGALAAKNITGRNAENYTYIVSVMEENLEKRLTVNKLSELCSMSVATVEKTIFKFSRCGALAFFNALKIRRAKTFLAEGKSVKETALLLGFSNQNYFSARFKKATGVYPTAWKKTE